MMKNAALIAVVCLATTNAFAPTHSGVRSDMMTLHFEDAKTNDKIKGDFYGELNGFNNGGHPQYNTFYPKAPKKLVGNFYKELGTQLEMKLPKKPAEPAPEMPLPEDNMVSQKQQPTEAAEPPATAVTGYASTPTQN